MRERHTRGESLSWQERSRIPWMGPSYGSAPNRRRPVAAFAEADPYVRNGLVTHWRIREWATVVGDQAANPIPAQPERRNTGRKDRVDIWRGHYGIARRTRYHATSSASSGLCGFASLREVQPYLYFRRFRARMS